MLCCMLDAHVMCELSGRLDTAPVASQEPNDHWNACQVSETRQLQVICTAIVPKQLSCVQSWHAAAGCLTSLVSTFLHATSGVTDARVSSAGALQDLQTEWQQ